MNTFSERIKWNVMTAFEGLHPLGFCLRKSIKNKLMDVVKWNLNESNEFLESVISKSDRIQHQLLIKHVGQKQVRSQVFRFEGAKYIFRGARFLCLWYV